MPMSLDSGPNFWALLAYSSILYFWVGRIISRGLPKKQML